MSVAVENVALPGLGPPPPEPVARSRDPEGALHELFGFDGVPAGPARGGRGRGRGPRRAGGHAHRLGQVALLPAAGAHAGGPHARGLAARVADAGPGAGARARGARLRRPGQRAAGRGDQPPRGRARGGRRAAAALRGARAVLLARLPGADPARPDRAVRGRRGALRVPVGARLPARLLPAGRRRALARRERDPRLDRDGHAAGGGRHRGPARAARPGARVHRVRPAEPLVRGRAVREQAGRPPRDRGRARRAGRAAGDRLRGHARGLASASPRGSGPSSGSRRSPTTPACRATPAPRRSAASWPARRRSSSPPTRSAWASTRPTCGPSATRACRARSRPTTRRPAARAATASPPAASCSPRARTRACTCSSSSAPTVKDDALRAVADRIMRIAQSNDGRFDIPVESLHGRRGGGAGDRRPPRAGGRHPAVPVGARPRRRPARRAVGRPRAGAVPQLGPGGHARALAPVPRRVGVGRGVEVPPRGDPAPLRRPLGARRPTGPCCDVCDPSLAPAPPPPPQRRAAPRPAQLAHRPAAAGEAGALDEAILDVVASAAARGRPHPRGRDPARRPLEGRAEVLVRRAAALRRLVAPHQRQPCSSGSTRC